MKKKQTFKIVRTESISSIYWWRADTQKEER